MNLDPGTPSRPHLKATLELTRETLEETKRVLCDIDGMLGGNRVARDEGKKLAPSPRTPQYVKGIAECAYEVEDLACAAQRDAEQILQSLRGYETPQVGREI